MNEFDRKLKEIIDKVRVWELQRQNLQQQITEKLQEITPKIDEFNKLEVPIIDGVPLPSITIQKENLCKFAYVEELVEKLPNVAKNIETAGMQQLEKISQTIK